MLVEPVQAVLSAQENQDLAEADRPKMSEECRDAVEQVLNKFKEEGEASQPKKAAPRAAKAVPAGAAAPAGATVTKQPTYVPGGALPAP